MWIHFYSLIIFIINISKIDIIITDPKLFCLFFVSVIVVIRTQYINL